MISLRSIADNLFPKLQILIFRSRNISKYRILGIESSCDDTGCAVVTDDRLVLGECVLSQPNVTTRHGGIMPAVARDFHLLNIQTAVNSTLQEAKLDMNEVDAIAVTVKPGLSLSLMVGVNYARYLCKTFSKNFIPVHHMEAHALTIRLINQHIEFPFLTFLISGGHCLLAVAHSVHKFSLLGQSVDDAPGEAFDKIARRIKAHNIPEYRNSCGGFIVEDLAKSGNPYAFHFTQPLSHYRNCNFSFSGIKSKTIQYIQKEEEKYEIEPDGIIPSVADLCASFQWCVTEHLCHRLQRAMEYISLKNLLPPDKKILVVSGGAASNNYIQRALQIVCHKFEYSLLIPPHKYCTDNGVMIAWNGMEKYLSNSDIYSYNEVDNIRVEPKCLLGEDLCDEVEKASIKCSWLKIKNELHNNAADAAAAAAAVVVTHI